MSVVSLNKPPLTEVWISFEFEPPPGGSPWTQERYGLFLKRIEDAYPVTEQLIQSGLRQEKGSKKVQLVEAVVAVRSFSDTGTRAVQLRPNGMVVNYIRSDGEKYPGFASLLDEAIRHQQAYRECYNPAGVVGAALHYVDVVEIPIPESGVFQSEEYFTVNLRLPEAFGSVADFHLATVLRVAETDDLVELVFSSDAHVPGESIRRFRLEWHMPVKGAGRMDDRQLRDGLILAHDRLYVCFRSVFTPNGWALFEPETTCSSAPPTSIAGSDPITPGTVPPPTSPPA